MRYIFLNKIIIIIKIIRSKSAMLLSPPRPNNNNNNNNNNQKRTIAPRKKSWNIGRPLRSLSVDGGRGSNIHQYVFQNNLQLAVDYSSDDKNFWSPSDLFLPLS